MARPGQLLFFAYRAATLLGFVLIMSAASAQTYEVVDSTAYDETEEAADGEEDHYQMPDTADYDPGAVTAPGIEASSAKRWFLDNGEQQQQFERRRMTAAQRSSLKADKDYWYADHDFNKKKAPEKKKNDGFDLSFLRGPVAQVILWMLIILGFAAVIAIYLRNNNIRLFRSSKKIEEASSADPQMDDIFAIDYDKEIARAAETANYRLATRLLFLRLLRQMADRNIIQYAHDRTNMDYLMQLAAGHYYRPFFNLARAYEYAWYGQFPVSEQRYAAILNEFNEMSKTVTSH